MIKCCVYCCPIDLSGIKGTIFHPIGEKVKCPNCSKVVKRGQIVVMVRMEGKKEGRSEAV